MEGRSRSFHIINARKKQDDRGSQLLHMIIQHYGMPVSRMSIQPRIVQPAARERIQQSFTQQIRPGLPIIQKMTFRCTTAYSDDRQGMFAVKGEFGPTESTVVAGIDNSCIHLWGYLVQNSRL